MFSSDGLEALSHRVDYQQNGPLLFHYLDVSFEDLICPPAI